MPDLESPRLDAAEAFARMYVGLAHGARALFAARGVTVATPGLATRASFAADESLDAASIGFTGQSFSGAIVLVAAGSTVRPWRPDGGGLDEGGVRDTVAEFANMILGSIKRELLPLGLVLRSATPTSFSARGLGVSGPGLPHSCWHSLTSDAGPIGLRLDAEFDGPWVTLQPPSTEPSASAGDVMLF